MSGTDALKKTSAPVVTSETRLGEVAQIIQVVIQSLDVQYAVHNGEAHIIDESENGSVSVPDDHDHPTRNSLNLTKNQSLHNRFASDTADSPQTDARNPSEPVLTEPRPALRPSPTRVRFRSRVRITSGVRRQHHRSLSGDAPSFSADDSSLSSSRCSSISAPLRSPITDANCKPGWGTLGQRVGLMVSAQRQSAARGRERKRTWYDPSAEQDYFTPPNERTPLIRSSARDGYVDPEDECYDSDQDEEAQLSREIDFVFGKWPGRLLNRHWWWWHLEPIMRCNCIDVDD